MAKNSDVLGLRVGLQRVNLSGIANLSNESLIIIKGPKVLPAKPDLPSKPAKMGKLKMERGWGTRLKTQFEQPYMHELRATIVERMKSGKVVYPAPDRWFTAFNLTPFDQVKVVILGQDPYHGPNQAHGLCFSVLPGVPIPPSLRNIYKEIQNDLGIPPVGHGFLESWAKQGVFLLNSVLTVEQGDAASHKGLGWETFTDAVINVLNQHTENTVFMLWGGYARRKGQMIDQNRHLVLQCAHPSPLSVRGFTGCRHFSKANAFLQQCGKSTIDWQLPESPGKPV